MLNNILFKPTVTVVKLNIADFHKAWTVIDRDGKNITSEIPYAIIVSTPIATVHVNISYNDIYPACDLVLYQTYSNESRLSYELKRKSKKTFLQLERKP